MNEGGGGISGYIDVEIPDEVYEEPSDNTPPLIYMNKLKRTQNYQLNIDEGSTYVNKFSSNENVSWSINGGDDYSLFNIGKDSGELEFKTFPDYEAPSDLNSDNYYYVNVTATDESRNTSNLEAKIYVGNIPPEISSEQAIKDTDYLTFNLKENTTFIGTLNVGPGKETLGFQNGFNWHMLQHIPASLTILGSDPSTLSDHGWFSFKNTIDGKTDLHLSTFWGDPLDYENPVDYNRDNSFHALISISDGLELQVPDDGTSSIIVNLTNEKEAEDISKLKIVLASDSSERSDLIVDENNDIIDILVTENIDTQWQIVGGEDANSFNISKYGTLTFKAYPDFENPLDKNKDNKYHLKVEAKHPKGRVWDDSKTYTITVKDLSDIFGSKKDDLLTSTKNDDVIDGGENLDTAIYSGNYSDYTFTIADKKVTVKDNRSGTNDGTDTLSNIEKLTFADKNALITSKEIKAIDALGFQAEKVYLGKSDSYKFYDLGGDNYGVGSSTGIDELTGASLLKFDDKNLNLVSDIKATFDQVTGKENATGEMFRLYNASFARFPDPSGLEYWIDKYSSGVDDSRAVASSFIASSEFKERYGDNVSDSSYVNTLYKNVLGRDADTGGLNYWLGQLNSGAETRCEVLLGFAESLENKALFTDMTGFG